MKESKRHLLEIALRAHVVPVRFERKPGPRIDAPKWPNPVLIFDTETTADTLQRFLFGSYRYCRWTEAGTLKCVEEGLVYADDLEQADPAGFDALKNYARSRRADVSPGESRDLRLQSRRSFLEKVLWPTAYKARGLIVGFNLPFDLSRLAFDCGKARGWYRGGFSLSLWEYFDPKRNKYLDDPFRPRVRIKHVNSKLAFMGLGPRRKTDPGDQMAGEPTFQGNFLDLRTLAFALTNESYSLEKACAEFGVEHGKIAAKEHGKITSDYVDYNRRDVLASGELLERLRAVFDRHPIDLNPCKAYSPASIAKAYLRAMGLNSPAKQFRNIADKYLGYAMGAYFGGRAECRIRKASMPIVYVDFKSMYPTVNTLMGLWRMLTAEHLEIVEATDEIHQLLNSVTKERCFDKSFWPNLLFFGLILPDSDIVPVRARYSSSDAFTIGLNPLTCDQPLWLAGPDLVDSALLCGKPPKVIRAFKLVSQGCQDSLRQVMLSGAIPIDPAAGDFFKNVVEERQRTASRDDLAHAEREWLSEFLKVLVNSGSYGIYAELVREELAAKKSETGVVFGIDSPFSIKTTKPERPGKFYFPPMAALITSAARLMLGLLEKCVTDAGGSFVFCDTDSMGIVATESGGDVKCGPSEIKALSWREADSIVARFEALNPYDNDAVPGSILKIEKVNYQKDSTVREQLFAHAISAKRYVLFNVDSDGKKVIRKPLEHGLGHLRNPIDPSEESTDWISEVWDLILGNDSGVPRVFPKWFDRPAISRLTITSPHLLKPFLKRKKAYGDRVKPSNFLLTAHVATLGHPVGVDPTKFQLVELYNLDPKQWLKMKWTDVHSGADFNVTTTLSPQRGLVRIKSIRDVFEEYEFHPEPKSTAPDGEAANQRTCGLLARRSVEAVSITYVGKESNLLEDVENEIVHDWDEVQQQYRDERLDLLNRVLREIPAKELAKAARISERAIKAIRNGHSRPSAKTRNLLLRAAKRLQK